MKQNDCTTALEVTPILTRTDLDAFTFAHHRGVQAPAVSEDEENVVSQADVATANVRFSMYGYTMSSALLQVCLKTSVEEFHDFFERLLGLVSKQTAMIENAKMVWPNYPDDVMNASLGELYMANLINYLSGGKVSVQFTPKMIHPALPDDIFERSKPIPLCPDDGAQQLVVQMLTNSTPMSPATLNEVKTLLSYRTFAMSVFKLMQEKEIPIKENLALYVAIMFPIVGNEIQKQTCMSEFKTARDVLRLAVAFSDGDVSLATNTRFRSFTRSERKFLLNLMENTDFIEENMANLPERWKRLGERLHPGDYQAMFPRTAKAFSLIRSGAYIPTFNSIMEKLMKDPVDVFALSDHLMKRPGMFARYLDFCLRKCCDDTERSQVAFKFISVAQKVAPRVLIQLINHFRNRNNAVRIAVGKSDGAAAKAVTGHDDLLPVDFCNRLSKDLTNELWQILRQPSSDNVCVYIDPESHCDKIIFPDNVRQVSAGSRVAACGSRFPLPDGNAVRCFLYWKGNDGDPFYNFLGGVDLDLSVGFYDADFEKTLGIINYTTPAQPAVNGIHSGDRRSSGSNGSAEYVDFDISAARNAGARYAVLFVNSYSGETFLQLDAAFCGVMVRDGISGELFEPATVTDRYDLTSSSRDIVAVVIDLFMREVIIVDRHTGMNRYHNLNDSAADVGNLCRYAIDLKSIRLTEMLQFRFPSRTNDWHKANLIVSDNLDRFKDRNENVTVLNPFDSQAIWELCVVAAVAP